jgi:hypothetical protein
MSEAVEQRDLFHTHTAKAPQSNLVRAMPHLGHQQLACADLAHGVRFSITSGLREVKVLYGDDAHQFSGVVQHWQAVMARLHKHVGSRRECIGLALVVRNTSMACRNAINVPLELQAPRAASFLMIFTYPARDSARICPATSSS